MRELTVVEKVDRESVELGQRIEKLEAFVYGPEFDGLTVAHRFLLLDQLKYMGRYHDVLIKRIRLFEEEEACK